MIFRDGYVVAEPGEDLGLGYFDGELIIFTSRDMIAAEYADLVAERDDPDGETQTEYVLHNYPDLVLHREPATRERALALTMEDPSSSDAGAFVTNDLYAYLGQRFMEDPSSSEAAKALIGTCLSWMGCRPQPTA